jgi:hypothetical protein
MKPHLLSASSTALAVLLGILASENLTLAGISKDSPASGSIRREPSGRATR